MEICFKCKSPETKVLLFDVILPEGIGKICGKCSVGENLPIIKNRNFYGENIEKRKTVRERLEVMSGVKLEEKKSAEDLSRREEALKDIVKQNFNQIQVVDTNMGKELIDNFHWVIMRARRMKHITQEQLAKSINEPEEVIKMIEKGDVPNKRELIRKLEDFLNVKIRKNLESYESFEINQQVNDNPKANFGDLQNLTISDLQKMKEDLGEKKFKPKMGTTVVISGYFDPLHVGHLELIQKSKALGDKLIVIVNSDHQAILKKGKPFMPEQERMKIVKAIKGVDEVVLSIDKDKSQCETLRMIKPDIFAQGGDRHKGEVPETPVCMELGIKQVDGLGNKIQSSSELIRKSK